ncbi:MAG TPA: hypothetical protein VFP96_05930 [Candidatus Acidoferrum sp.]|nr:hypothetical protein [Candidatus Acidoferrum sp.]
MNASRGSNTPLLEVPPKVTVINDRADVIEAIGRATSEATRRAYGDSVRAVILTGSLSRNEGSIHKDAESIWRVHGDAEFLILLRAECALPIEWDAERNGLEIEASLFNQGIHCPISLGYCHEDFFRSMTPHMFAYETRVTGIVVSGEFDALTLIPQFSPSDMPLEDAWRTLSNRMIELLEAMAAILSPTSSYVPDEIAYRCMKLTLDTATSVLLFEGKYAPTYSQRAANILQLATEGGFLADSRVSLSELAEAVACCTDWKLSGHVPPGYATWSWVEETCQRALAVWHWELQKLSGDGSQLPIKKLLGKSMQRQSIGVRVRGWLYVARREGWLQSCDRWPRWFGMALRGTPRYWTYEAAGELFCRLHEFLPTAENHGRNNTNSESLRGNLPLWPSGTRADAQNWRDFARAVAFNYRRYLEGTRA